jgi:hypothetical protein
MSTTRNTHDLERLAVEADLKEFQGERPFQPVTYDRPLNRPWCDSPFLEQSLQAERLSPVLAAMARKFARDGYLVIDPGFSPQTIDATVAGLKDLFQAGGEGPYGSAGRVQDAWMFSPQVRDVATDQGILDLLYVLYRRQPIPFQTLNFPKGTQQKTHSDTIHFHSVPHHFMCGVWVAFEDVDLNNGPLHYYPGSHRLPVVEPHDLGLSASAQERSHQHYPLYESFIEASVAASGHRREELQIKKGQALIWAANLLHGGSPIRDLARTRHSQVTHYYFTDCVYLTPMMSDLALGKAFARKITNIANGRLVPQVYNGQPVENPGEWPPVVRDLQADPLARKTALTLSTTASRRVMVWPRYRDPDDLDRIFRQFGPVVATNGDACLCLRYDPTTDPRADEVVGRIQVAARVMGNLPLSILIVDNELPQQDWARFGPAITCAIAAGGPVVSPQADFNKALGVPVVKTADDLRRLLSPSRSTAVASGG